MDRTEITGDNKSVKNNARVSARINADLKASVCEILQKLGITETEAIHLFYNQINNYKGIPFPLKVPNEETLKAMEEIKQGKSKRFSTADELFEDLEI